LVPPKQTGFSARELIHSSPVQPLPVNVVPFRDAALFWVIYYDHVIYRERDERRAFDSTKKYLQRKITGGFQLWENDD